MATYTELFALKSSTEFAQRIEIATLIAARKTINDAQASASAKQFAQQVITGGVPGEPRQRLIHRALVAASVIAAGPAVTDAQLQNVVDNEFGNLG